MATDYLQNIRNRMKKDAKGYPQTSAVNQVMSRPPAVVNVGTSTGSHSGTRPTDKPMPSAKPTVDPGGKFLGLGGAMNSDKPMSNTGRLLRAGATGMATQGPTGALIGLAAEGARQLASRFSGGSRRANEFANQYGNRALEGRIPIPSTAMPEPSMSRWPGAPSLGAGVQPGGEGPAQPYTVPSYSGGGGNSGAAPTVPGDRVISPLVRAPRSNSRRVLGGLRMSREMTSDARDRAALADMRIHDIKPDVQ